MSLLDIYEGRLSWAAYLDQQARLIGLCGLAETTHAPKSLMLSKTNYEVMQRSGCGALAPDEDAQSNSESHQLDLSGLSPQLIQLQADFFPLLGELMWKQELQTINSLELLEEIKLAEFEREARAFRTRAERAYLNGWYEEALSDFLEAEKRHYPDYVVLRSIANLYLYHLTDLDQAKTYFLKAAKYARPADSRQAAEAHYFAGLTAVLQQQAQDALVCLQEAVLLEPQFAEAHYLAASVATLLGRDEQASQSLESAIQQDARYYERVRTDPVFNTSRSQTEALLLRLLEPLQERVAQVKHEALQLRGYLIVAPEQERFSKVFQQLDTTANDASYREQLSMLERLNQLQEEIQSLHERFAQRFAIDPRDYVRSLSFSQEGRWIGAGFLHGGVQVWEVETMQQQRTFSGHLASVNSVAFSPNDLLMVTGSRDRTIKLWETETGSEIKSLEGHTAEVRAVVFSPDGQWLVSASHDQTIRIWRAATGHQVDILRGHTRPVTSLAFTPNGQLLASGSWDHKILLWDLAAGTPTGALKGHEHSIASLTICRDGRWLASGGERGEVKLWDLETGKEIRKFIGLRNSVTSVAFSPDQTLLAAGSLGRRILVWRCATGEVVRVLESDCISYNSAAFSPRGEWLALGSRDVQLWLKVILTRSEYEMVKAGDARTPPTTPARFPPYLSLYEEPIQETE